MAVVFLCVGFKGGIGKTFTAAAMGQYIPDHLVGEVPILVDLDYKSPALSLYEGLDVKYIELETEGEIDKRKFDVVVEMILNASSTDRFIMDTGSNTFPTMANYMKINGVFELLSEAGHDIVLHIPVMGGQELTDTIGDLREILEETPEVVKVAVWINQFHGVVEHNGKTFEQSDTFKEFKHRITSITYIPKWKDDMARDISEMLKAKYTFAVAQTKPSFRVMERQRLKMAQRYLYAAIEKSGVCL